MLYPGSRFRMADELLELYLRQLIEAHARSPEVVVAWQGGEPTMMGLDFFRRSVELAEQMKGPGQRLVCTIQTNGTLLDDAWGNFFAQHGFLVGLSIDGPREIHDTYRVDKGGKGSFDRVMAGLDVLQRTEVQWNALTHRSCRERGSWTRGLPVPARCVRGALRAVHPDHRTRHGRHPCGRQRRMGREREGPPPVHTGGGPGDGGAPSHPVGTGVC
jgi:hypothetical protein